VTIRARLTLAVVVLVVLATGGLGFVVVGAARDSMVERLDETLVDAQDRPIREGGFGGPGGPFQPGGDERNPSDLRSVAQVVVLADGTTYADPAGFVDDPEPLPDLPEVDSDEAEAMVGRVVTVPAVDGSGDLRVLTTELPRVDGLRFQAISLDDVDETTRGLRRVYFLAVVLVAAGGAAIAWIVVRRGLQPIDSMIVTAGAIAAGDLTRRVDHPPDGTELGRLGSAIDEMLTQLEAAFTERERSETRLKRFAADASHELRTPLTAIRGYAELYRKGGLSEEESLVRAMGRIESESLRMGRLVEDLLLLARLDQQRPLEATPVDLRTLVLDAAADHRALDDSHTLVVDADASVVVRGDEASLRQVLGNLLANARHHTPELTPIRLALRATGDGWAELVVSDEGPGIPPEHLDKVFERFNRGDPSRARSTGGSGLGLSIVHGLVAAHGGTTTVSNAPGGGAVITLRIPTAA
jgi:two-component system OmpR family sensor kinase